MFKRIVLILFLYSSKLLSSENNKDIFRSLDKDLSIIKSLIKTDELEEFHAHILSYVFRKQPLRLEYFNALMQENSTKINNLEQLLQDYNNIKKCELQKPGKKEISEVYKSCDKEILIINEQIKNLKQKNYELFLQSVSKF